MPISVASTVGVAASGPVDIGGLRRPACAIRFPRFSCSGRLATRAVLSGATTLHRVSIGRTGGGGYVPDGMLSERTRLELNLNPRSAAETADIARRAEEAGFSRIGIWDSPSLHREAWVTLATVATATHTVPIGTNVTNPLTRHPAVTASAAATLQELSEGRAYIGIGSGDSGVYNLGLKAARQAHLREYILAIKDLLATGSAEYHGKRCLLSWDTASVPIYLAAHGPRSLRLAGEVADGVIVGLGLHESVIANSLDLIDQGARESGRTAEDLDIWWYTSGIHFDPDPGKAVRDSGWIVVGPAHHLSRHSVKGKFVPEEMVDGVTRLGDSYDLSHHGDVSQPERDAYMELAQREGVLDYLVERFLVAGTPSEVMTQLDRLRGLGVQQLAISLTNRGLDDALAVMGLVEEGMGLVEEGTGVR